MKVFELLRNKEKFLDTYVDLEGSFGLDMGKSSRCTLYDHEDYDVIEFKHSNDPAHPLHQDRLLMKMPGIGHQLGGSVYGTTGEKPARYEYASIINGYFTQCDILPYAYMIETEKSTISVDSLTSSLGPFVFTRKLIDERVADRIEEIKHGWDYSHCSNEEKQRAFDNIINKSRLY